MVGYSLIGLRTMAQQIAFPSAEGFGAIAQGGRGGIVMFVTNLDERGPGSFRACAEAGGPRTCIFRIGGTIDLQDRDINIRDPFITIAGQTAPGGDVAIKNGALILRSNDVIIRHFRFRFGLLTRTRQEGDCLSILPTGGEIPDNIIIDHCSFSWAWDSNIEVWGASQNLTIQWCILSEAMRCATPYNACGGQGILFGAGQTKTTFHHNLLAHNKVRNPKLKSGDNQWINNVVYNGPAADLKAGHHLRVDFIGNYYKQLSPHQSSAARTLLLQHGFNNTAQVYLEGNIDTVFRPDDSRPENDIIWESGGAPYIGIISSHLFPILASETNDFEADEEVLAKAGARVPEFDSVDERIINEVRVGTGGYVSSPADAGGYPFLVPGTPYPDMDSDGIDDRWEIQYGLNPNDCSDGAKFHTNGYTNLENFLNQLAGDEVPGLLPVGTGKLKEPCPYRLAGDLNDDCRVDFFDYTKMAENWLIDCNLNPQNPACIPK